MVLSVLFRLFQKESRASSLLSVTVTNLFMDNSNETNGTVTDAVNKEIEKLNYGIKYTGM